MKYIKLAIILIIFNSCASQFDQIAYDNAIEARTEALNVISKANTPYLENVSEIDSLRVNFNKYYNYEKTRKNNSVTIKLWKLAKSENGTVFNSVNLWKKKDVLNSILIEDFKIQIASFFDQITKLELKKKK